MRTTITTLLIVFALLLTSCQDQKVTCNKPYILVGTTCCLDQNDNAVCDKDESVSVANNTAIDSSTQSVVENVTNNAVQAESDDNATLSVAAEEFGRLIERGDAGKIYDLLTPERKSYKTRDEFIKLYPYYQYGRRSYINRDGLLLYQNATFLNHISAYRLDYVKIENNTGFAYYETTYDNGWASSSSTNYFKKAEGTWKFDGFSNIVFGGCFEDQDCYVKPDKLQKDCEQTCLNKKNLPLKSDKPFICLKENSFCQCACWDDTNKQGSDVAPDWNSIR